MSKDKGSKDKKKAPSTEGKKAPSDYQSARLQYPKLTQYRRQKRKNNMSLTVALQANVYLFDLNNCAKEYWFKDEENWDLFMVSGSEKLEIERKYKPSISKKALPETLIQLHRLVKAGLTKANSDPSRPWVKDENPGVQEYLIAFNRNRQR